MDGDIIGGEPEEKQHSKFLGRKISWKPWGLELEANEKLVQGLI